MTLRAGNQGTGLLRCDPNVANGQAFTTFLNGCQPWYGANKWTTPWWTGSPLACPPQGDWFSYNDQGKGFGTNSSVNYWQCVPTDPGGKTGQVGDWMSVATKNCNNVHNNSCGTVACNNDGNYDGKNGNPNGWVQQGGNSAYPRVVDLFIVPYQALKETQGSGSPVPILGFASFYVMNWKGNSGNGDDPCPDTTFDADENPATPQVSLPTRQSVQSPVCSSRRSNTSPAPLIQTQRASRISSRRAGSRSFDDLPIRAIGKELRRNSPVSNTSLTSKVQQSRGWTLALGIGAAALAAILLIAYLVQYRSSVNDSTAPSPVLVAKNLIPKGTSGTVIAEKQLFQAATLSKDDLKVGAISDPAYLNGRVAVADIFPGQQITTADLSVGLTDALPTQLTGKQRAVAIPVSGARGLVGFVSSGDRVDIYYETGSNGGNDPRSARTKRARDARAGR